MDKDTNTEEDDSKVDAKEAAARHASMLKALEEFRAENAMLQAQLILAQKAAAGAQSHSESVTQELHDTKQQLGATRQQLEASKGRETALKAKVELQDLELAAWKASNVDLRQHSSLLQSEISALKVCLPCQLCVTAAAGPYNIMLRLESYHPPIVHAASPYDVGQDDARFAAV